MNHLAIDIETFSSRDLKKCGVYAYTEAPDFEILLFGYSVDGGPVQVVDMTFDALPVEIVEALRDPAVTKSAHNAAFERVCIARYFGEPNLADPEVWSCTMVKAAMVGLPLALDHVAEILSIPGKLREGRELIKHFCVPCKPTKANGGRVRNTKETDPEKWEKFKAYCARDVEIELEISKRLKFFTIPEKERRLWMLDQKINDRGILCDLDLVDRAIALDAENNESLIHEAIQITGLENPKSVAQLKKWLEDAEDIEIDKLDKDAVPELLKTVQSEDSRRVLEIRQQLSKSSVKKYTAMKASACADGRIRGTEQYYGANRTGRWAGRIVQVQNLPKTTLPDLDLARQAVMKYDLDWLRLMYGSAGELLSQLVRTAFVAPPGHTLLAADFSAIEARVLAWLAKETWRMDVFKTHGKIYEASAAAMFKVPIESVGKGSELRSKGKIGDLALGYQGGVGAMIVMGALKMGLSEDELPGIVTMWRAANKKIVDLWGTVDAQVFQVVRGERKHGDLGRGATCEMFHKNLVITLPSGRPLYYINAHTGQNRFGNESVCYWGMNQTTKKWEKVETYGGKLVENIVQAIARDCLAEAMLAMIERIYSGCIVFHVHDEIVLEVPDNLASEAEKDIQAAMSEPISWAPGLDLKAETFVTKYYKKD